MVLQLENIFLQSSLAVITTVVVGGWLCTPTGQIIFPARSSIRCSWRLLLRLLLGAVFRPWHFWSPLFNLLYFFTDRRAGRGANGAGDNGSASSDDRGSRRASSRGIIPRAKVKTVKMTIVIVIVFVMCWSPYIIFDLLQVYNQIPRTQTNLAIATFVQSLAPLNSAANPLIYCLFSTQVCRTLR